MTLTWNNGNDWAGSSTDERRHGGLTDLGKRVVRRMNELGMLVDLSHVSDSTFWDVLATTTRPVIASHSSCRAIAHHPRNLSDAQSRHRRQRRRRGDQLLPGVSRRPLRGPVRGAAAASQAADGLDPRALPRAAGGVGVRGRQVRRRAGRAPGGAGARPAGGSYRPRGPGDGDRASGAGQRLRRYRRAAGAYERRDVATPRGREPEGARLRGRRRPEDPRRELSAPAQCPSLTPSLAVPML